MDNLSISQQPRRTHRVGFSISEQADEDDPVDVYGVRAAVLSAFPELWPSFDAALSVITSMSLAGRELPLSLILESGSGNGKSQVISSFFPHPDYDLREYIYRSDSWTPKAFVSHSQSKNDEELDGIDMLPKLLGRTLLTKELAPIFRGDARELVTNFRALIAVLDGQGHVTDSGSHAQRGYDDMVVFNWLGGTTPLPDQTYRLMSQLGNRLLFWQVPAVRPAKAKIREHIQRGTHAAEHTHIRVLINGLVSAFFAGNPVGTIEQSSIEFSDAMADEIDEWGELIVRSRAEVKCEKDGSSSWAPVSAAEPEGPWRVKTRYLPDLARGHAVLHGRDYVDESDLAIIAHVAISTVPGHLRPIVRLLASSSEVTTGDVMNGGKIKVSHPTARRYMKELHLLNIGVLHENAAPESNYLTLHPDLSWLQSKQIPDFH